MTGLRCFAPAIGVGAYGVASGVVAVGIHLRHRSPSREPLFGGVLAVLSVGYAAAVGYAILAQRCNAIVVSWHQGAWGVLLGTLMWIAGIPLFVVMLGGWRLPQPMVAKATGLAMWAVAWPLLGFLTTEIALIAGVHYSNPAFAGWASVGLCIGAALAWLRAPGRFVGVSRNGRRLSRFTFLLVPVWVLGVLYAVPVVAVSCATAYALQAGYWRETLAVLREIH